jgi:hypothetical protein
MKKFSFQLMFIISCGLLILPSCKKDEPKLEVTFHINISGFIIESDDFGSLKSTETGEFDAFVHTFPSGTIIFTDVTSGAKYTYSTGTFCINGYAFTMPIGSYKITGYGGEVSVAGWHTMSFTIPEQTITITEQTTTIDINVAPTCTLIVVYDENNLVQHAYISNNGNDLYVQGKYYYTYMALQYNCIIEKYDGAILTIHTNTLKIGYYYKVIVTEAGGSTTIDLDPGFTETEPFGW